MLSNNVSVVFIIQLVQQKDGIQTELTRMSLAKTKLESLCCELQKHSKAVVVSVCVFDVRMCLFMCVFVYVCVCAWSVGLRHCQPRQQHASISFMNTSEHLSYK